MLQYVIVKRLFLNYEGVRVWWCGGYDDVTVGEMDRPLTAAMFLSLCTVTYMAHELFALSKERVLP